MDGPDAATQLRSRPQPAYCCIAGCAGGRAAPRPGRPSTASPPATSTVTTSHGDDRPPSRKATVIAIRRRTGSRSTGSRGLMRRRAARSSILVVHSARSARPGHLHGYDLHQADPQPGRAGAAACSRPRCPACFEVGAAPDRDPQASRIAPADRQVTWLLAHGIGGIRDLPVPLFVLLRRRGRGARHLVRGAHAFLWKRPLLEDALVRDSRFRPGFQRSCSRTITHAVLATLDVRPSSSWSGSRHGLRGGRSRAEGTSRRPSSTSPSGSASSRSSWSSATSLPRAQPPGAPPRTGSHWTRRKLGWAERAGRFPYPAWLGRWPAAVLLFSFAALELALFV